ncbi:hypothetical protein HDU98_008065 [Podochytrium sp. JEL0797]|nr:hypothetical protein HDU98_008065 [Podochytrium sp. JEL0797]
MHSILAFTLAAFSLVAAQSAAGGSCTLNDASTCGMGLRCFARGNNAPVCVVDPNALQPPSSADLGALLATSAADAATVTAGPATAAIDSWASDVATSQAPVTAALPLAAAPEQTTSSKAAATPATIRSTTAAAVQTTTSKISGAGSLAVAGFLAAFVFTF